MARHRTEQEKLDIAQLYLGGTLSMRKFSEKYGISTSRIHAYVKLYNNKHLDEKIITDMNDIPLGIVETETETETSEKEWLEIEETNEMILEEFRNWIMVPRDEYIEEIQLLEKKRYKHKDLQFKQNFYLNRMRGRL